MNVTVCSIAASLLLAAVSIVSAKGDHLLISEVVLSPAEGEFVEIANPTYSTVDLTNYYLSDNGSYWKIVANGQNYTTAEFFARFPAGATIAPRSVAVVSIAGNTLFSSVYGRNADFELRKTDATPDMLPATMLPLNSIGATCTLGDTGECVVLYYWDGKSDLVKDVDIVDVGAANVDNTYKRYPKGGVSIDGPDADTVASTYPADRNLLAPMATSPGTGVSAKRPDASEGTEVTGGGNGITGDDETSENTQTTWIQSSPPDPGVAYNVQPVGLSEFLAE